MNTNIPCENMDMAGAAAATLVWGNLARRINSRDAKAATRRAAAIAVYGISWNRSVITALTTNRIDDVLALLRRYTPFHLGSMAAYPSF